MGNRNAFSKTFCIRGHIHKGQFKVYGAVKEVEERTPFLKNLCLILLQCKLIIDVLKLDGLGVVIASYTADTILEHPLERNTLLRCSGYFITLFYLSNDFVYLALFFLRKMLRQRQFYTLVFLSKIEQFFLPPSVLLSVA